MKFINQYTKKNGSDYYYDGDVAQDVDISILVGKNLRIRLEGSDIAKKIKHWGAEMNYESILKIRNLLTEALVDKLTDLINDDEFFPDGEED